jgi:hypothetical protein
MAEFLRTSGISYQIEDIIINAKEKLIIISPYLKLTDNLFERLKEKDSENIELIFIYGKSELNENEKRKLHSLKNLSLYYYKNLHAKCYFNESKMLITSMNLHEFSERNNREMGIFVEKQVDSSIFENAEQESFSIIKAATIEKKAALKSQHNHQKSIEDFEFNEEGDISKWLEKLQALLSAEYNALEFKTGSFKPVIECESFLAENLSLEIEPSTNFLRIVFKFNGKNKKDLFYMVQAKGKKSLENSYPEGIVGWGNQMMRIKLDFSSDKFPHLLKFDKSSITQTLDYITIGGNVISGILNQ